MVLNQDCVRDILLCLEENMEVKKSGKITPIKGRELIKLMELRKNKYEDAQIYLSMDYLVGKKFILISQPENPTSNQHIMKITATGFDYLAAIRSDNVWNKLKNMLGNVSEHALPVIFDVAKTILLR